MSDLPPGWMRTSVGDIAEVRGGIQKQAKRRPVNNKYPFLRVANVGRGMLKLQEIHEIELFEGELERFAVQAGDLLVVEGNGSPGEIGRAAMWRGEILNCVHQNHLICVRPTPVLLPKFLELLWSSPEIAKQLRDVASSTSGLHTLSTSKVKAVRICLPPSEEQRRIVAILEDHLSRLAAADQSILTGVRRALRLRQSIVDQMFNDVSGASTKRLASLLAEPLRNGHSARASETGEGIRTLTLTAVTRSEFTDLNTKHTVADPFRVRDLWLRTGDILVERANTPELVGTSALYTGPSGWAIYPDLLIRARINEAATPEYVQLILSTTHLRSYFRRNAKGLAGSMPKIDHDTLLRAELPIPSIEEQSRIVASVNNHKDAIDRLHRELETSRRRSSQFRRLLLAEAFAGRLVPQDPSHEPASVLLERVRTERAGQPSAPRGRRTVRHVPQEEMLQ
jgi:type I restriction enzyme S subunit